MKLFKTSNIEIINECRISFFGIELPSVQLVKRFEKCSCNVSLLVNYIVSTTYVCLNFVHILYVSLFYLSVCLSDPDVCLSIYVVVRFLFICYQQW